jgi:acylaminoacyl-peptidase
MVVKIHGGPHASALNSFSLEIGILIKSGFHVLLPNYRGSGGFGADFLNALPGHCGRMDVDDCAEATRAALGLLGARVDPGRVIAYGGSHGGFLTGWLLGNPKHQDLFCAGVLWNPAVDLLASNLTSDIPEWSVCETLGVSHSEVSAVDTSEAFLVRARQMSATSVAAAVKSPALVVLGGADMRVNAMAGLRWAQIVEEKKRAKVDVLWYSDQGHSIAGPEAQEHVTVSIIAWILDRVSIS